MNTTDEPIDEAPPGALRVGEWWVVPALNQISRAGRIVRLEPKAVELLCFLARRAGEVASREELLAALWPGVVVGDNALTQVVTKLRKALGDTAREPTYIEAISKRGYRLVAPVERPGSPGPPSTRSAPAPRAVASGGPPSRWVAIGAAALAVAVAVSFWIARPGPDTGAPAVLEATPPSLDAKLPTLVVQPIEAIGGDSAPLMARGLTADLVNDLSKISGLWVVSGNGADDAKPSKDEPPVATGAGRYALAGTLRSDGKALRLDVRLVDANAGRQVWSQRFERPMHDLFALQDDLARTVLEQLPIKVSQAETAKLAKRYTRSVAAYEVFLRGQAAVQARQREQNERAREMYWKAIELDPAFARAYAGLAMTYALAYQLGWDDEAALGRAAELAGTAVQMSPGMPEPHWVLAFVEMHRRRHTDAIGHLRSALRLNPSFSDAYALMGGIRTYTGEPAEGVSLLRTALRLNPDAGSLYFLLLGRAYFFLRDYEQARVNLEHALTRNAENVEARVYLVAVLGQLGDRDGAAWQADEIRTIEPTFSVSRWLSTYPMTDKSQVELLTQALLPFGL